MKVKASTVDITPMHPVVAGGYLHGEPLSIVSERLEANLALLHGDGDSDLIAIISLDLLYPGRILRTALESALPELRPDQIFLTASHTHHAPMTDDTKLRLGVPDARYMDMLVTRLSAELRRLINSDRAEIGMISTATATAKHSINRRLKRRVRILRRAPGRRLTLPVKLVLNTYLMAPDQGGATDELLTVLISRSKAGRPQFVIWNYACHPVAFPDGNQIAADYPYHVRNILRDSLGMADLPVLFLQGFSGNTRPSVSVAESTGMRSQIRRLPYGPRFGPMTLKAYVSWATELGELVAGACADSRRLEDVVLSSRRSVTPTSSFVEGAAEPEVSFQSIRVGSDFAIVGASAEVVAEFAPWVRAMVGSKQVMCVGCLDHPFGYAPTSEILRQGGYEGGDYCATFGLGPVANNVQEEMLKGFRAVI